MTMAPFVVEATRCTSATPAARWESHGWLAALDVNTGKELWRAFSTGPDSLVRIGADYKPFYSWLKGKDLGATTWPADAWKHGAGAVWGWVSYDPDLELDLLRHEQPGAVERGPAAGAQPVDERRVRARSRHRHAQWAFSSRRTTSGTTTA